MVQEVACVALRVGMELLGSKKMNWTTVKKRTNILMVT